MDTKKILKFLKENRVTLSEEADDEVKGEVKEGDKAKAKDIDGKEVKGEVIEIHGEEARIKDEEGEIYIVKKADLEAA